MRTCFRLALEQSRVSPDVKYTPETPRHIPSLVPHRSHAAESRAGAAPRVSHQDPTVASLGGVSPARLPPCLHLRGQRREEGLALPERASLQYEPVGVVLVLSSQQKLCHTLHRRGLWGRGCADVSSWQSYP